MQTKKILATALIIAAIAGAFYTGSTGFGLKRSAQQTLMPTGQYTLSMAGNTSSITQHGITWTFDKEYEFGQFVNGDYWIVGPVTIVEIEPGWNGESHGSMVNPVPIPNSQQAYDSRMRGYNSSLLIQAPMTLNADSSLISAISWIPGEPGYPIEVAGVPRPTLKTAAVLTVLEEVPPSNAFRPPYTGNNKPIYLTSDLRKELLPNLAFVSGTLDIQEIAQNFERVWLDHFAHHGDITQYTSPSLNMPINGRDYSKLVSKASLLLMLDETELISQQGSDKDTLLIRLVQLGIDLYEVVENGGYWWAGGSLNSGRKWPILFAGIMLDNSDMKDIGIRSQEMPYQGFQEDAQTFYVGDRDIFSQPYTLRTRVPWYNIGTVGVVNGNNIVTGVGTAWVNGSGYAKYFGIPEDDQAYKVDGKPYEIVSVIDETHIQLENAYTGDTSTGKPYYLGAFLYYGHGIGGTNPRTDFIEYTEEHRDLPEWGQEPDVLPWMSGLDWSAPYRGSNGPTWLGSVLAAHIMGQKGVWNHDALFDYTDRWVSITSEYDNTFVENMWTAYRANYGCVWTRNNQFDLYSPGHYDCSECLHDCLSSPYCGDGSCNGSEDNTSCAHDCGECEEGATRQCGTTDAGECEYGTQTCTAGAWENCIGATEPETEQCTGSLDEDCDSLIDCTDTDCTTAIECTTECNTDSDCPQGQTCQNNVCTAECIDESELIGFISEWKQGGMPMLELMQKMRAWKTGEGC